MSARKRGFTILEFAVIMAIIAAALLAMQIYFKRAVEGRWKSAIDTIGFGRQY